jgi:hypothetical protein
VHLERIISGSAAVRRATNDFELGQIWTSDPNIAPRDEEQRARMKAEFGTTSIPLHAIVDPFTGKELARFRYDPRMTDDDYVEFLAKGLAAFREARKQ